MRVISEAYVESFIKYKHGYILLAGIFYQKILLLVFMCPSKES